MTSHLDRMNAERVQRLARMKIVPASPHGGARADPGTAAPPGPPSPAPIAETATILSRLEAIERALALSRDRPAEGEARARVGIAEIKATVCRYYGLAPADIASRSRPRDVVRARRIAIYLARRLTGKSFRVLARAFGDHSHPSIIRACRVIERLRSADAHCEADLQALVTELGAVLRPHHSEPPSIQGQRDLE
jgi:Bacterial dnaA protein helix-turn-helix